MSTENDVPLGDDSRRYYEQQFGDRIRQVNKGGGATPKSKSGGSNWNGRAGCGGGAVAAFVVIRIVIALFRVSSSPSHNYSIPDPPEFQLNQQDLDRLLQQAHERNGGLVVPLDGRAKGGGLIQLVGKEDIPLLRGLCYRIHRESKGPGESPGKHILQLLDPDARDLLVRSAEGKELGPQEEKDLLEALDDVLYENHFYTPVVFRNVPGVATWRLVGDIGSARSNRLLLEKCYPQQIVPLGKRDTLTEQDRARWKKQAQEDLDKAKVEDKRAK